jgi:hypothetical protein
VPAGVTSRRIGSDEKSLRRMLAERGKAMRRSFGIVGLVLAFTAPALAGPGRDPACAARLRSIVETRMAELQVPGAIAKAVATGALL